MNKILANMVYIIVHDYRLNSNGKLKLRMSSEFTFKYVRHIETKFHLEPSSYSGKFKTNTYDLDSIDVIKSIGKVIYN
ncbi:hypothetical protein [Staphylococcus aureus]